MGRRSQKLRAKQSHAGEMKEAHTGMEISNSEFDAVVGDLKASLDKLRVPNAEQKEFLAIIETTKTTRALIVTVRWKAGLH